MINLNKGGNLNLSKASTATKFRVGLSWDKNTDSTIKDDIDIDVFGLIVDENGKGLVDDEIRFYNNIDGTGKASSVHYGSMSLLQSFDEAKKLSDASVLVCTKDNQNGEGDGDDETMFFNSTLLPKGKKIIVALNIYEAKSRKQLFGMVKNAKCKVYESDTSTLLNYDLGEDYSLETGVIVGEFYWNGDDVKFKALGTGFEGDLNDLVKQYK